MNKQAFAFLTLFTLILMLSVYYVTFPADQSQLNPDELLTGQTEEEDPLQTMQQQLDEKRNTEIQNNEATVSSGSATTEQKQEALQQVDQIQQTQQTELAIVNALAENGLDGWLAELDDDLIRVACPKSLEGTDNASLIMKIVSSLMDGQQIPEVTFQ